MRFDPDEYAAIAEEVARATAEAEQSILRRLTDAVSRGVDNPAVDYQREALANMQTFRAGVVADLQGLNAGAAKKIEDALFEAYFSGRGLAFTDLGAFATATSAITAPATRAAIQAVAAELTGKVAQASGSVLRRTDDVYQQVVGRVVEQSVLGGMTRKQAAQAALNDLAGRGITLAPQGTNGRQMNLTDYVTMATRTGAANAAIAGHIGALVENGLDLVQVQPGPRSCEICDRWANKILSISGGKGRMQVQNLRTGEPMWIEVDGTIEEARAAGWGHPNCRCAMRAYLPGITRDSNRPTWNQEGYEAQQRQRDIERKIREYKTQESIAIDDAGRAQAKAKVEEWQAAQRQHMADHPYLKRQYGREGIGGAPTAPAPKPTSAPKPPKPPKVDIPKPKAPEPTGAPTLSEVKKGSSDAAIQKRFAQVYEGRTFGDGFTIGVNDAYKDGRDVYVDMTVFAKNGEPAGVIRRAFSGYNVDHEMLELVPEYRGKGFSSDFSRFSEQWYKESGLKQIQVHAALDDGAYAWAKAGYTWDAGAYTNGGKSLIPAYRPMNDYPGGPPTVTRRLLDVVEGKAGVSSDPAARAAAQGFLDKFATGDFEQWPLPQDILNSDYGSEFLRGTDWYGVKKLP